MCDHCCKIMHRNWDLLVKCYCMNIVNYYCFLIWLSAFKRELDLVSKTLQIIQYINWSLLWWYYMNEFKNFKFWISSFRLVCLVFSVQYLLFVFCSSRIDIRPAYLLYIWSTNVFSRIELRCTIITIIS